MYNFKKNIFNKKISSINLIEILFDKIVLMWIYMGPHYGDNMISLEIFGVLEVFVLLTFYKNYDDISNVLLPLISIAFVRKLHLKIEPEENSFIILKILAMFYRYNTVFSILRLVTFFFKGKDWSCIYSVLNFHFRNRFACSYHTSVNLRYRIGTYLLFGMNIYIELVSNNFTKMKTLNTVKYIFSKSP